MTTHLNHPKGTFEYALPDGFVDDSNLNDMCPSAYSQSLSLRLFIDSKEPANREEPNYSRFAIYRTNDCGETLSLVFESEHYDAITHYIDRHREPQINHDDSCSPSF